MTELGADEDMPECPTSNGDGPEWGLVSPETMADRLSQEDAMLLPWCPCDVGVAIGDTDEFPVTTVKGLEAFKRSVEDNEFDSVAACKCECCCCKIFTVG